MDVRARMHQDMHTTVVSRFTGDHSINDLIDALCDDAMFQIEHLLVEIEALHIEKKARDERDAEADTPRDEHHTPEVWHG